MLIAAKNVKRLSSTITFGQKRTLSKVAEAEIRATRQGNKRLTCNMEMLEEFVTPRFDH